MFGSKNIFTLIIKIFLAGNLLFLYGVPANAQTPTIEFNDDKINKVGTYTAEFMYLTGDDEHINILTRERKNFSTDKHAIYRFDAELNHIETKRIVFENKIKPAILGVIDKRKLILSHSDRVYVRELNMQGELTDYNKVVYESADYSFFTCTPDSSKLLFTHVIEGHVVIQVTDREFNELHRVQLENPSKYGNAYVKACNNDYFVLARRVDVKEGKDYFEYHIYDYNGDKEGELDLNSFIDIKDFKSYNFRIFLTPENKILGYGSYRIGEMDDSQGLFTVKASLRGKIKDIQYYDLHKELTENKKGNGLIHHRVFRSFKLIERDSTYYVMAEASYSSSKFDTDYTLVILKLNEALKKDFIAVIDKKQTGYGGHVYANSYVEHLKGSVLNIIYKAEGPKQHADEQGTTYYVTISEDGEVEKTKWFDKKALKEHINPSMTFRLNKNEYITVYDKDKYLKVGRLTF